MRLDFIMHAVKNTLSTTIAIIVYFVWPIDAHALSCARNIFTLNEAYEAADSIIVGVVTECQEEISSEPWANGGGGCSFDSLEVLKESTSPRDHRGVASSSGCGLSLRVGDQYLFFLDSENRPMRFSGSLANEQYFLVSNAYKSILQEFRDGIIHDLSEPWIFREHASNCSLSHNVGGYRISFRRLKAGAADPSAGSWSRETVDGKTIYRGSATSTGANSTSSLQDMEVVVTGDLQEYPVGAQMLSVSFLERSASPVREATLSVGAQSWPLYRREMSFSYRGRMANTQTEYVVGGDVAEQILSAMTKPSNVTISAVLVNSSVVDTEPRSGSAEAAIVSSAAGTTLYRSRKELPEAVLRLETRTTQLPAAAERFQACYEDAEH
ncbi:MAG: hypothetical protein GXP15_11095 [Gammaproteobacteria bacterium]|nr:hypothetical protein [Gammaproteobacteria bacterium]